MQVLARRSCISGRVVNKEGISVDPEKIRAITKWQRLINVIEMKFLGFYEIL